jgi:putative transposase
LGWIKYRKSRSVLGEVCNVTVSRTGSKWFASIQTERLVSTPVPTATSAIGGDVGIKRFVTFSDGSFLAPLNSFKKLEDCLARAQQAMFRKVKFSRNWIKAKAKVTKIHTRIAQARKDYLHKASTTLSQSHALVCVENLQVKNMSASASGTIEAPGSKVAQKSGLNKAILDQGWSEFRRQLDYKLNWNGGMLLAVPPRHTSQKCPACMFISKDNRKTQALFKCIACNYENHADVVGAINILTRGLDILNEGQDMADASARCASTARIACEVNGAVPPSAAGTRRSDSAAFA